MPVSAHEAYECVDDRICTGTAEAEGTSAGQLRTLVTKKTKMKAGRGEEGREEMRV